MSQDKARGDVSSTPSITDQPAPAAVPTSRRKHCLKRVNLEETCYTIMAHTKPSSTQLPEQTVAADNGCGKTFVQLSPRKSASAFCAADEHQSSSLTNLEHVLSTLDMQSAPAVVSPLDAMRVCLFRLQQALERHSHASISLEEIARDVQYSVSVLSLACNTEQRRLEEADTDDLSEVSPSSVPQEVIEWLESTFTRTKSTLSDESSMDRVKFRSVATAIRAGIIVDKISRKTTSSIELGISEEMVNELKRDVDSWSFNTPQWNENSSDNILKCTTVAIFHRYDIMNKFKISPSNLETFLQMMQLGYSKYNNPYHNCLHAADVLQTCHSLIQLGDVAMICSDLEIFSLLFSAIIHDYEHSGTSNGYHVNASSKLAILYNDRGVLENHHVSAIFQNFLANPDTNIVKQMDPVAYKIFRGLVIEMVISTDMSLHFHQVKTMRSMLAINENIEKSKLLSFLLHSADISHPTKAWELHYQWSLSLSEEFFRQGDREKEQGLPISPMCDRESANLPQGQIGFIDAIVFPTFDVVGELFHHISLSLLDSSISSSTSESTSPPISPRSVTTKTSNRPWVDHLNINKNKWKEITEHSSTVITTHQKTS